MENDYEGDEGTVGKEEVRKRKGKVSPSIQDQYTVEGEAVQYTLCHFTLELPAD